jgi:hypothetical protein
VTADQHKLLHRIELLLTAELFEHSTSTTGFSQHITRFSRPVYHNKVKCEHAHEIVMTGVTLSSVKYAFSACTATFSDETMKIKPKFESEIPNKLPRLNFNDLHLRPEL